MTVQPNTPALRSQIEKALDEIISNEEGMRFQALAVVLAHQGRPELVASERKTTGPRRPCQRSGSPDGIGKGLACSITGELPKIVDDATKVKAHFDDVSVLFFATPQKVTVNESPAGIVRVVG